MNATTDLKMLPITNGWMSEQGVQRPGVGFVPDYRIENYGYHVVLTVRRPRSEYHFATDGEALAAAREHYARRVAATPRDARGEAFATGRFVLVGGTKIGRVVSVTAHSVRVRVDGEMTTLPLEILTVLVAPDGSYPTDKAAARGLVGTTAAPGAAEPEVAPTSIPASMAATTLGAGERLSEIFAAAGIPNKVEALGESGDFAEFRISIPLGVAAALAATEEISAA